MTELEDDPAVPGGAPAPVDPPPGTPAHSIYRESAMIALLAVVLGAVAPIIDALRPKRRR